MKKACPLRALDTANVTDMCIADGCAWYDVARGCCCLVALSSRLWDIDDRLKELAHASTSHA